MLLKDRLKSAPSGLTANPQEVEKFNALAEEWWKPDGKFKVVHAFNAARVGYLVKHLSPTPGLGVRGEPQRLPLSGLRIVDVGCGAGLVSEPLARAGAEVLAIDAAERNIAIARHHAEASGVDVTYRHALPEDLDRSHDAKYDVVISLEVVEHVEDLAAFLAELARLVAPGGTLVIGTLNRTAKSYALGIIGAEYVLRLLPRGTHEWSKFVMPDEIDQSLRRHGLRRSSAVGVTMNPITWTWSITRDMSVNYLISFAK